MIQLNIFDLESIIIGHFYFEWISSMTKIIHHEPKLIFICCRAFVLGFGCPFLILYPMGFQENSKYYPHLHAFKTEINSILLKIIGYIPIFTKSKELLPWKWNIKKEEWKLGRDQPESSISHFIRFVPFFRG